MPAGGLRSSRGMRCPELRIEARSTFPVWIGALSALQCVQGVGPKELHAPLFDFRCVHRAASLPHSLLCRRGQIAPDIAPIPPSSLHSLRRCFVAVLNGAISQTRTSMRLRSVPASCCSSITARLRTCPSRSSPSRRGMYRPRQPCSRALCEYGVSTSSWRDVGEWLRSLRTSSTCCTGIRRSTSSSSSMRNCS